MTTPFARAPWLTTPETSAVMLALETALPGCARFVGGCVRNTLMGHLVDDIDIATQLQPEETLKALRVAKICVFPTGIEHGTVTAIVNHIPFEITSLRRDVETDGRRAVVEFTRNWAEDAQRRDFRLNAVYANVKGHLFDPTGGGIDDAKSGRVIFIGEADQRLREDYLRILRFFRFNAWYGADMDAEGLAACARQKEGLGQIAPERIWKEIKKLLYAPRPQKTVLAMWQIDLLDHIIPGGADPEGLNDLYLNELVTGERPDPMRRFMALLKRSPDQVEACIGHLKLSNHEAERLRAWADPDLPGPGCPDARTLRNWLYRFGPEPLIDMAMLSGENARDIVAACKAWPRPAFPVKGEHLLKGGLKPGPAIGKCLRDLEAWWIAGDFTADKDALLEELERRLKAD